MQAEHIPVHLGAMPASVDAVLARTTAPAARGSSTTPSAAARTCPTSRSSPPVLAGAELLGSRPAARTTPTSAAACRARCPFDSRTLAEEGVVIAPRVLDDAAIERPPAGCASPPSAGPTSRPAGRQRPRRAAPARARTAPGRRRAARRLRRGARLRRAAHPRVPGRPARRDAPRRRRPGGRRRRPGAALAATVAGDRLILDFRGSAAQDPGNLNCPVAVTRSACLFALRVLTDADIPPSAGAHRPGEVITEPGTLLDAAAPAAVAGGNVETSSRVADLVLAAFGRACGRAP